MKKICIIAVCLVLISTLAIGSYAKDMQDYPAVFDDGEFAEIRAALGESPLSGQDKVNGIDASDNNSVSINSTGDASNTLSDSYKLFETNGGRFAAEILDGKSVSELISTEYSWIVLGDGDTAIKVIDDNDEWRVSGQSTPTEVTLASSNINSDAVNSILEGVTENITDLRCISSAAYYCNFVYINTESNEYLIPFSSRPDFTGLENGSLYTAYDAAVILNQNMPATEISDASDANVGGAGSGVSVASKGSDNIKNATNSTVNEPEKSDLGTVISITSVVVLLVVMIFVGIRLLRKSQSTPK